MAFERFAAMNDFQSTEQQAEIFASSFPESERAAAKEWYLGEMETDRRAYFWQSVQAGLTAFVMTGVLPTLALWAFVQLS